MPTYKMKNGNSITVTLDTTNSVKYQIEHNDPCKFSCECGKEEDDLCRSMFIEYQEPEDKAVHITLDNINIQINENEKSYYYSPNDIEKQCIQEAMYIFDLYSLERYSPIIDPSYYGEEYFGSRLTHPLVIDNHSFERVVAKIVNIDSDERKKLYIEDFRKKLCAMSCL